MLPDSTVMIAETHVGVEVSIGWKRHVGASGMCRMFRCKIVVFRETWTLPSTKEQETKRKKKHTTGSVCWCLPSAHGTGVVGSPLYSALSRAFWVLLYPPKYSLPKRLACV